MGIPIRTFAPFASPDKDEDAALIFGRQLQPAPGLSGMVVKPVRLPGRFRRGVQLRAFRSTPLREAIAVVFLLQAFIWIHQSYRLWENRRRAIHTNRAPDRLPNESWRSLETQDFASCAIKLRAFLFDVTAQRARCLRFHQRCHAPAIRIRRRLLRQSVCALAGSEADRANFPI